MALDVLEFDQNRLGKKLTVDEVRRVQIDMLDALAAFCDAHGLTYYLSGGTLLGAVRHKGYIPWDDDIDINMPRPDYEEMMRLTRGVLSEHLEIASPEGPIEHNAAFPRICDKRYVLKNINSRGNVRYYTNLFIDIFPIEGLPSDMTRVRIHYLRTRFMLMMRRIACSKGKPEGRPGLLSVARNVLAPLARLKGARYWNRRLLKISKKYSYETCAHVGVTTGYAHSLQEYIEREGYGVPSKVEFEGKMYNAPANTDKYLRNLYGDYMQLPPPEKRVAHHFEVWEIKED